MIKRYTKRVSGKYYSKLALKKGFQIISQNYHDLSIEKATEIIIK